ncbi:MAG: DUF3105 domain-containing protein [Dehalococcoidia bacterium]
MASKNRPPKSTSQRPRPVAARRQEAKHRADSRSRLWWLVGGLAALIVVGIGVWQFVQPKQADGAVWYPSEGSQHVANGTDLSYNNYPPASGPHFGSAAAPGFYRQSVPEGNWIHSLEHGYVVVLYKPDVGSETIAKLEEISLGLPNGKYGRRKIIMAPYERMESPVTALAWQHKLPLSGADAEAIRRFYVNRVDQGPEDVP